MKQLLVFSLFIASAAGLGAQVHLESLNRTDSAAIYCERVPDSLNTEAVKYSKQLYSLLLKGADPEKDFCFIMQPSFQGERALLLRPGEKFGRLTVRTMTENLWVANHNGHKARVIESEQSIEQVLSDAIQHAFTEALTHVADKPHDKGFDGTVYLLLMPGDSGRWTTGTIWSPVEDSPTFNLTQRLTELLDMPLDGDTSTMQRELNALRFDEDE